MESSLRYEQTSCMRGWRSKALSFVYYTDVYYTENPCFTLLYRNWSGWINDPVPEKRFVHNAHARCYAFQNAQTLHFSPSTNTCIKTETRLPLSLNQSHLPSSHPVLHLSSHLAHSNSSLPNFRLTSLCASHIHLPNPALPSTLGSFPFLPIHSWKSSAHVQHGYRRENKPRNCFISDCWPGEAVGG